MPTSAEDSHESPGASTSSDDSSQPPHKAKETMRPGKGYGLHASSSGSGTSQLVADSRKHVTLAPDHDLVRSRSSHAHNDDTELLTSNVRRLRSVRSYLFNIHSPLGFNET